MTNDRETVCQLLPSSGDIECKSMRAFVAVRLNPSSSAANEGSVVGRGLLAGRSASSRGTGDFRAFATALSRSLGHTAGRSVDSLLITTGVGRLELLRFVRGGAASAAVLLLDASVLFRFPPCDWQTAFLRTRNQLAEEGVTFYVTLVNRKSFLRVNMLSAARGLYKLNELTSFCTREGIGLLSAGHLAGPAESDAFDAPLREERLAEVIASDLMSPRFFCCNAFRIAPTNAGTDVTGAGPK